jgi:hypothetical protein
MLVAKKDLPAWMADGKRFVAGLQKADDPCCYLDFFDSDTLNEAQMMATNSAKREQRKAIVFDRKNGQIAFRYDFTVPKELPPEQPRKQRERGKQPIKRK